MAKIVKKYSEVGIYKRKQESKTSKHAFDQERDQEKKERKHALDQDSDQEKTIMERGKHALDQERNNNKKYFFRYFLVFFYKYSILRCIHPNINIHMKER